MGLSGEGRRKLSGENFLLSSPEPPPLLLQRLSTLSNPCSGAFPAGLEGEKKEGSFGEIPGDVSIRARRQAARPNTDHYKSLRRERGGVWGGAGEAFLQKSSPAPSKSFSISLPIPNYSCTTQGRPRRLSCSMNGSGSSCSMFQTPGCIHLPVTIIMAPIMAGTPVV